MKFKPIAKNGTDEDIKKILLLNYPGCNSIAEALEKQTKEMRPSLPQDLPLVETIGEVFYESVNNIESYLNGFDIDLLDPKIRFDLSKMPTSTIPEIKLWREKWLSVEIKVPCSKD